VDMPNSDTPLGASPPEDYNRRPRATTVFSCHANLFRLPARLPR
jgi:hypothetical protein